MDRTKLLLLESVTKARDFTTFPAKKLEAVLSLKEYADFKVPVENYISHLFNLSKIEGTGIDTEVINVVAHAILSYLTTMYAQGNAELARFMLPPEIDPYSEIDPHHEYKLLLIASWEDKNRDKIKPIIAERFKEIYHQYDREANLEAEVPEPASTNLYTGSMFSEKTLKMLKLLSWLVDANWKGKVKALIADAMEEDHITTRVGQRANIPLSIDFSIPATRVTLETAVAELSDPELEPGDLVILDEGSFITWTDEDCSVLDLAIDAANKRGIFVEIAALNNDFRDTPLPFTSNKEREQITYLNTVDCNAYYAYRNSNGEVITGNESTSTFRIDVQAQFGDLLLPVVISRIHGDLVSYLAVPSEAHFFAVLRDNDPEMLEQLLAVGSIEELKQYYISQAEQLREMQEA